MSQPQVLSDVLDLLNLLLECERAGAQGVMALSYKARDADTQEALREIAGDEARFCAMLTRHIERLGGTPSKTVGAFYDKLMKIEALDAQLSLLDRGQGWVADKLRETLPGIEDPALTDDLLEMLTVHEVNIERARSLGPAADA